MESNGIDGGAVGFLLRDHATKFNSYTLLLRKRPKNVKLGLKRFQGPMWSNRILHLYIDGAPEIVKAGKNLRNCHDTSTPYRSATNGLAEREIRNVLEGTRTLLEHSGLPTPYWPYASRCFCHHANIRMVEGDSAWNKRHEQGHFEGRIIPFGALIDFRPPKPILSNFSKFEKRSLPGIFLGYHLMSGERWYGDYLVAHLIDFKEPPTGGVRICRVAELITEKAKNIINFLSVTLRTRVNVLSRMMTLIIPTCMMKRLRTIVPS